VNRVNLKSIIREPLLHFFVLGAVLFVAFGWLNPGTLNAPEEIVVDSQRVNALRRQFERDRRRPPSEAELGDLIDSWVKEEILYREGLALGLDRGDSVLRARVVQKMSLMADALRVPDPTDAQLQEWLEAHPQDYQRAPTFSFRQVYLDPARHPAPLDALAAEIKSALQQGRQPGELSDATHLPASMAAVTPARIGRTFGDDFAAGLAAITPGAWQGPLTSAFGLHLVFVSAATPAQPAALAEVRSTVARDYQAARRKQISESLYGALRERYTVRMAEAALHSQGGTAARQP
jgi:hypothetical protein